MADEAISSALDRLQSAIDRLETALDTAVAASAAPGNGDGQLRDEKLRAEVQAVIAELDRMIGGQRD